MTVEEMEAFASIARALAWPIVALIVGYAFRNELKTLIGRLRRGAGIEFDPPSQQHVAPPTLTFQGGHPALTELQSPVSREIEAEITKFPPLASTTDPAARETLLIAMLGRTLLSMQFQSIEHSIWASQLRLLEHLNSVVDGESVMALSKGFYERAVQESPQFYESYPFHAYLRYLENNGLIFSSPDRARISPKGQEYLIWRMQQRLPPKTLG